MKQVWLTLPAAVSAAVFVLAAMAWTLPPIDLVRHEGASGAAYVGTAFGQLVVDLHGRERRRGERFGSGWGIRWAGVRVVRCDSLDRANRTFACRLPLTVVTAVSLPLPVAWSWVRWRRGRAGPAGSHRRVSVNVDP